MTFAFDGGPRPLTRAQAVPIASTLAGSATALLPFVATYPALPPFGLLVLLAWRLLRPELWRAWIGLPLGLADDLIGGAPIGSAVATWTILLLALDYADARLGERDWSMDWLLAVPAILFGLVGALLAAWITGGGGAVWTIGPQALTSMLAFPAVARGVAALDRWRLRR